MRRLRMRVALVLAGVLVAVPALWSTAPTLAAWQDREFGRATFTAGSVQPPASLTCSAGLLQPARFTWTAPASGLTPSGYRWTFVGPGTNQTNVVAPPTPITLSFSAGGLSLGSTYTFTVLSVGPTPWTSSILSGRASFVDLGLAGVLSSCSVP